MSEFEIEENLIRDLLGSEQFSLMDLFLNNPIENPHLVIIGKSTYKRKAVIKYICSKHDWKITWGLELLGDIIGRMDINKLPEVENEIMNQSALVIDDLDFFKCDKTIQHHLASIIHKYNKPIVLALENQNVFSEEIKNIIDDSLIIKISDTDC